MKINDENHLISFNLKHKGGRLMLADTIYEHFKEVYDYPIKSLIQPAVTIESSYTVSQVINKISENDAYDVFCMENGSVLATNVRALLLGKDILDMNIRPFLSVVPSLSINDAVQKAANILTHYRIRSVPVVSEQKIIGVVSADKILELVSKKDNKWINANVVFTSNPITIDSNESLSAARKIMTSKRIDHLPVLHKGVIKQVLTSSHLVKSIIPTEKLTKGSIGMKKIRNLQSKIGNIGSTRIPQCSPKDDLNQVITSMQKAGTTCCLVNLWGEIHGIITVRDILSLLAIKMESEIPLYIVGLPEDLKNDELIHSKFVKALKRIQKVYTEIQEARVTIKQTRKQGQRKFYEVSIRIITPHNTFRQEGTGWDLSNVIEEQSQKLLRNLSKRAKRRYKTSIRKLDAPITEV